MELTTTDTDYADEIDKRNNFTQSIQTNKSEPTDINIPFAIDIWSAI